MIVELNSDNERSQNKIKSMKVLQKGLGQHSRAMRKGVANGNTPNEGRQQWW